MFRLRGKRQRRAARRGGTPRSGAQGGRTARSGLARTDLIVYLSAISAGNGFWGEVETAIADTSVQWTSLRAGGFATNTLGWADTIRRDGVVRWPYGRAARSPVHERDLADAAVRALTTDDHVGRTDDRTGPESLTQAEQVREIGAARTFRSWALDHAADFA